MLHEASNSSSPASVNLFFTVSCKRCKQDVCLMFGPTGDTMQSRAPFTPSFKGLKPASEASSRAKRMNRSSDTTPERALRSQLWQHGLRYRKNVRSLPGKPDIVFSGIRLAVFCDGDFWHGREWRTLRTKLRSGTNASYWLQKIKANRLRDQRTNRALSADGWTVVRIWESEIKKAPEQVAQTVFALVQQRREATDAVH
jgi:DNA mismatch endonuclease, patch repair protein